MLGLNVEIPSAARAGPTTHSTSVFEWGYKTPGRELKRCEQAQQAAALQSDWKQATLQCAPSLLVQMDDSNNATHTYIALLKSSSNDLRHCYVCIILS